MKDGRAAALPVKLDTKWKSQRSGWGRLQLFVISWCLVLRKLNSGVIIHMLIQLIFCVLKYTELASILF